jgi:hypothetical protein
MPVGPYSEHNLRYVAPGALVKFNPTSGKYFDKNNNLVPIQSSGVIPDGGKDYLWAMVYQVIGDGGNGGSGALDDGTGPIIFAATVPQGAVAVEVVPAYVHSLPYSIENEIANLCMSQRNFGLTVSADFRNWDLILNSNLDLTSAFSLDNQGNVEDAGLDASWVIAFIWTGKNYKVRYRNLNFIFESESETGFFIDSSAVNYDFTTNSVIKDKIDILAVNAEPESNRQWFVGAGAPGAITTATNGDYYLNTTSKVVFRRVSNTWLQGNNFTGKLVADHSWQIDGPVIESDGYVEPKKIKVSFYDYNNTGQIQDPDSFATVVYPNYIDPTTGFRKNFVYFKRSADGLRYTLTTGITPLATEADFFATKFSTVSDGDLFYFYDKSVNVVKFWDSANNRLTYTDEYFARVGRSGLKFQYTHNSGSNRRIDPSKSNFIDIYVLTTGYDNDIRSWLSGSATTEPLAPTSFNLEQNYFSYLEPIKAISDEIIFHPIKYKILFGSKAHTSLQAKFKAVKNSNKITSDNDLKTRILIAINEFFALQNWDFGQSFYFSELSTYVMNQLSPDITNFVITPKSTGSFGSLYEIACQPNEIFISGTEIADIEIIDAITASQLKTASSIVTTTSGT